jgi:secreted PhoX family phosphatase
MQFMSEDTGCNDSPNAEFQSVLDTFLSRRGILKGGVGAAATLLLGGIAGCNDDGHDEQPTGTLTLDFNAVAKSVADVLAVPAGYTASVLYGLGDPIAANVPAYGNSGTETGPSFAQRSGDHHDGMEYFGLGSSGTLDRNSSSRGLICVNHENITQIFLHASGPTTLSGVRTVQDEVVKEINAHGIAIYEIRKTGGTFSVVRDSSFNRRITPNTLMELAGPVAGSALVRTLDSPTGLTSRGTINNCATGHTPWGTFLTCEENWAGYFRRAAGDDTTRGGSSAGAVRSLQRYGLAQGAAGSYNWATVTPSNPADLTFRRWDATRTGTTVFGTDDFRNEPNTFGYIVEIDPFSPASPPRKRTAMGRMAHEAAAYGAPVVGQPIVFYMGDDSRGEYIYKFVSNALWAAADASGGIASGDKYLNAGTLYAAKFNADGTGEWLPLTLGNAAIAGYSIYAFADHADICINTRLAADAVGATKMDRPEWTAVNPNNGDIYCTLTNNNAANRTPANADAPNPRAYGSGGNPNGHIIRMRETGYLGSATTFAWDIYLFGSPSAADTTNVNLSGLTGDNDFSSPDGIWFDQRGICWIQTDDGAYTGTTNCMMLAAIPGSVGDGGTRTVTNTVGAATGTVTTRMGLAPTSATLRRFLVGPRDCEITGIAMTPDNKTMFVNIQHPGESTSTAQMLAGTPVSTWPAGGTARPRSATVAITKDDGGTIGGRLV